MKKYTLILLSLIFIFIFSGCGYNKIQTYEEAVFKAWGDIESNLQRRADLIPNLVEVVKGYASHEKETLQAVIEARSKATAVMPAAFDFSAMILPTVAAASVLPEFLIADLTSLHFTINLIYKICHTCFR